MIRRIATLLLVMPLTAAAVTGNPQLDSLQDVTVEQRLNAQLPLHVTVRDEAGNTVPYGQYFDDQPVVVIFAYYECPSLCTMVLNGMLRTLRSMNLKVGEDFKVVVVSIDPDETAELAREKKASYLAGYGHAGGEDGWFFLTAEQESIAALTDAAGFRYYYDEVSDEFSHASAIMVATPEGRLSKYFYGIEFSGRDLRRALVEASEGEVGTAVEKIIMWCTTYDPSTGKYSLAIMRVLRLGALVTMGVIGITILGAVRAGRQRGDETGETS